tara:strand:- start:73 stop:534 length:462 start_codon:yes stop_codon:yes gene_type:complete
MKKVILIILLSISFSFTQNKETNEGVPKFEQLILHPEAKKIVDISSLFYRGNLLYISYPEPYTGMVVELGIGKADFKIFDQSGFVKIPVNWIHVEFNVRDGLLHGEYRRWYSGGTISNIKNYKDGKLHGEERIYGPSGRLNSIVKWVDGERQK